ncbi:hypothetical protein Hdeb2414_s0010g00351251 [Helianthus debilis subsp. tardiflorus]
MECMYNFRVNALRERKMRTFTQRACALRDRERADDNGSTSLSVSTTLDGDGVLITMVAANRQSLVAQTRVCDCMIVVAVVFLWRRTWFMMESDEVCLIECIDGCQEVRVSINFGKPFSDACSLFG